MTVNDTPMRIEVSVESLWLATDAAEVGTFHLDLITDVVTWFHRTKMFGNSSGVSVSIRDLHASLHPEDFGATAAAFASAIDLTVRATSLR